MEWAIAGNPAGKAMRMEQVPAATAGNADTEGSVMGKILIVDDAKINRMILAQILKDKYDLLEAEDGLEAVEVFRAYEDQIDLVLLDAVMPVSSGFDFLSEANRFGWLKKVPVIMISTDNSESAVRRAYEGGASAFIERPFDGKTVLRKVEEVINRH